MSLKLDTRPLPAERFTLGDGEWTITSLRRLVCAALGPRARIWPHDERGWCVGLDKRPGRGVVSWGETPVQAVEKAFDVRNPLGAEVGPPTEETKPAP